MHLNKKDLPPIFAGDLELERQEGIEQGIEQTIKQIISGLIETGVTMRGLLKFQSFQ
ncbi:hypothetical protein [Lysinibacillus sphaericus]|uniref:hypothetical protein n=1 Tax=Lysinibacillus sphaericus TaxID=1421 RepID=UPI00163CA4DE|nr:hypothetical protein [Lysinibacillus sp. SDF0037]